MSDYLDEFRCSGEKTSIGPEYRKHFEEESRAVQLSNGKWVGWTYYFGGGEFNDASEEEWLRYAYEVDCTEKEVTTIVKTFTKKAS